MIIQGIHTLPVIHKEKTDPQLRCDGEHDELSAGAFGAAQESRLRCS